MQWRWWQAHSKCPKLALLHSMLPVLQQATAQPHLCWRLLDTHSEVWVNLLWGHHSFLLCPGAHKVVFVPSKSLFPQSSVRSIIKSQCLQSQILWEFSVPLPYPQVGKPVVCPWILLTVQEFLWYNCSAVGGSSTLWFYGGVNYSLLQEGLCHRLCYPGSCTQSPCPCSRPVLTCTSAGGFSGVSHFSLFYQLDIMASGISLLCPRFKQNSGSVSVRSLSPGMHKVLFEPSEHFRWVMGLILNTVLPLLPSC